MNVFYLVRHAHVDWSQDENRPLSSWGLSDAERLAHILGNLPISGYSQAPTDELTKQSKLSLID